MPEDIFKDIVARMREGKRFLVVSHVNPEGDAVGSLLGMTLALRSIGKDAVAYLEDPVPEVYEFLPGADTVVHSLDGLGPFDATFAVDCGQRERLGKGFGRLQGRGVLINIDHHATNDRFGDINAIVPDASAAGELVYDFCMAAGIKITRDMAVNLYVAIHTDTGSFRYSSSTPESFIKAGELVRAGAEPWSISRQIYETNPANKYKLLGMVLSTLEVLEGGKVAAVSVTLDMLKKAEADKELADGFVNYTRSIKGVEVGVLFREFGVNEYKISMRSKGDVDVAAAAAEFGGGGHRNAAGFNTRGTVEEIKAKLLGVLRRQLGQAIRA